MSAEEKQIQLINNYLNNELTVTDKHLFEQALATNSQLAAATTLFRDIQAGIRVSGRRDMKAHFVALENRHFKQQILPVPSSKPGLSIQLLIAVSGIAACLVLGIMAYFWLNQQHTDKLFASYYTSYPNVIASIERGGDIRDEKARAMQAYENGNYPVAIEKIQSVLKKQPQDAGLIFYLGLAYLENNELDEAIEQLEKAALLPEHDFSTQAAWYLSLAYIKRHATKQAIPLLQTLAQGNSMYSKRASLLLEEL